mgnify:CR=1 FL=1
MGDKWGQLHYWIEYGDERSMHVPAVHVPAVKDLFCGLSGLN